MKKTIANFNPYFLTPQKRENMIVNVVYTSAQVEGSKTTKEELRKHYKRLYSEIAL